MVREGLPPTLYCMDHGDVLPSSGPMGVVLWAWAITEACFNLTGFWSLEWQGVGAALASPASSLLRLDSIFPSGALWLHV